MAGVNIAFGDAAPSAAAPSDTSQYFVVGLSDRGPVGSAQKVTSTPDFVLKYGDRVAYSVLYDAVDAAFRSGVATVYVSRLVGPAAVIASKALDTITVKAKGPGDYANTLKVAVIAGTGSNIKVQVSDASGTLETSPDLADAAACAAWSASSAYVDITATGSLAPAVAAAAFLTGGTDDRASITTADYTTAYGALPVTLGPGQVSAPGVTTAAVASATLAHAAATNRVALIDTVDSTVVGDLTTVTTGLRTDANASYGAAFGPFVEVPGIVSGTTRHVPISAVVAGLCARADTLFNPGRAAAGREFPLSYVVDLHDFSDADHQTALLAGANLAKDVFGTLEMYGFRSLVDPDLDAAWVQFNYARLRMAITAKLNAAAENFVFAQIDGNGHTLQQFADALTAVLKVFYDEGALFGATPSDAFVVDLSPNTPATAQAGELHARIGVKFSPHAEVVYIDIAKTPLAQTI